MRVVVLFAALLASGLVAGCSGSDRNPTPVPVDDKEKAELYKKVSEDPELDMSNRPEKQPKGRAQPRR